MCVLSNVIVCTKEERAGKCEKKKERERGSQRKEGREGRELVLESERERGDGDDDIGSDAAACAKGGE